MAKMKSSNELKTVADSFKLDDPTVDDVVQFAASFMTQALSGTGAKLIITGTANCQHILDVFVKWSGSFNGSLKSIKDTLRVDDHSSSRGQPLDSIEEHPDEGVF